MINKEYAKDTNADSITYLTEKPLVSVILPVYNTEPYLSQCLASLHEQTMEHIEIIVVDDGSTDRSGDISEQYAAYDHRFRVIHKKNEGLSAARNDGIDVSRADYIMFVDSDDWVEPDYCEIPYRIAMQSEANIVAFSSIRYKTNNDRIKNVSPQTGIISKDDALIGLWQYVSVNAWNKLYKKSLFEEIRFPVGHLSEDTAVMHHLIDKAKGVYLSNRTLYHHRDERPGSIM